MRPFKAYVKAGIADEIAVRFAVGDEASPLVLRLMLSGNGA